ncbi:DUF1223 domain-containing protein [Sandarakinorhabdus sp.]|uniref:DUF1223 domain-containing protein n=1 Tax=Sandarakinorhabdus sp. TaxID=1916663 RepID=UPI00286E2F9A|nr:DUF1223 domain-containing protein [Sandarakinorhabdus sp.]
MKCLFPLLTALLLTNAPAWASAPLVVVELYQSQGCSSCPPANANLNAVADRADLLPLSFSVTYWDQLGWKDSFAKPQFTQRQWDYARAQGRDQVWTPQVYVGGRKTVVGRDAREFGDAIAASRPAAGAPQLQVTSREIAVAMGKGTGDVWLVRYDPRSENVPIRAGENGGRTLPHRNIVKQLVKLGRWNGRPVRFVLPAAPSAGLVTAAIVQSGKGGPILAAARG